MKPIKELLGDQSPKNMEKLQKAFNKGECEQYLTQVLAEAGKNTAMDFPKVKCLITDNYFVDYEWFLAGLTSVIRVYPLDQISNLYRTNIDWEGHYEYDKFHLALEMKDGTAKQVASVKRNAKTMDTIYADVLTCVRGRLTVGNTEV